MCLGKFFFKDISELLGGFAGNGNSTQEGIVNGTLGVDCDGLG